jgi:L-ribulose-5-phosphate 4-epimerase
MDELGHFSVRISGEELVLMNGKVSPGQTTAEDLIILDLEGRKIEGKLEPAKEIPLHLSIYQKRPEVVAVAHTHSPTVVALSIAGVKLQAMDNLGATTFGAEMPMYDEYGLVDTFEMGYRIVDAMADHDMIVLKGHGNILTGKSIEEACVRALWVEKAAQLQYKSMLIGKPKLYTKKEIDMVQKQVIGGKAYARTWNYYQWRLDKER